MELGRDSDTGGQVKYVVELSRALARMPGVYRVDLFTRQVSSPEVDWSYGEPAEMLTAGPEDGDGDLEESSGAYIIRIPFGPRDQYLSQELLWPYIQEFVDGALAHILINIHKQRLMGGHVITTCTINIPHIHILSNGSRVACIKHSCGFGYLICNVSKLPCLVCLITVLDEVPKPIAAMTLWFPFKPAFTIVQLVTMPYSDLSP
ncbi:unnamed protein product [Prunus armeniaca]